MANLSTTEVLAGIRSVAENFVDGFGGLVKSSDEIGVEFGVSLSTQADVIVSGAAARANFKVSLIWHRPPGDDVALTVSGRAS